MGKSFLHRLQAKDYAGSWKNPLFSDPNIRNRAYERTRFILYTLLVVASGIACVSLGAWYLTQERFFVNEVHVSGMRSLPNEQLEADVWHARYTCKQWGSPCLFMWNEQTVAVMNLLKKQYPLEFVTVQRQDRELRIEAIEAVTSIPLVIGNETWFASQEGVLQARATQEEITAGIKIPNELYCEIHITDALGANTNITEGEQVLTAELFKQIEAYKNALKGSGINVQSFHLTNDAGKIIAHTGSSYDIFFTPWQDPATQVRRMLDVLQEATPLEYIDIRFGERIYVK